MGKRYNDLKCINVPNKTLRLLTFCFDYLKVQLVLTFWIDFWISAKVKSSFYVVIKGKLYFSKCILLSKRFFKDWIPYIVIIHLNRTSCLKIRLMSLWHDIYVFIIHMSKFWFVHIFVFGCCFFLFHKNHYRNFCLLTHSVDIEIFVQ